MPTIKWANSDGRQPSIMGGNFEETEDVKDWKEANWAGGGSGEGLGLGYGRGGAGQGPGLAAAGRGHWHCIGGSE